MMRLLALLLTHLLVPAFSQGFRRPVPEVSNIKRFLNLGWIRSPSPLNVYPKIFQSFVPTPGKRNLAESLYWGKRGGLKDSWNRHVLGFSRWDNDLLLGKRDQQAQDEKEEEELLLPEDSRQLAEAGDQEKVILSGDGAVEEKRLWPPSWLILSNSIPSNHPGYRLYMNPKLSQAGTLAGVNRRLVILKKNCSPGQKLADKDHPQSPLLIKERGGCTSEGPQTSVKKMGASSGGNLVDPSTGQKYRKIFVRIR